MDSKRKTKKGNFNTSRESEMILKKHVGLIHCENKLTLIQRKICNILLFNALDTINDKEIHEISLRQLCSLVGYNSNDSKLIKDSIKNLISIVMEWNLLEDNKFLNEENYPEDVISWNASSLLAGASIKKGVLYYSYSPQIKSVLSSLEIYGRINLFVQAKFNSTYSLVLYENCVRFKTIKKTAWFPISLFRSLMGVSADKYPSFKEFKRNVINVSVKEINQKSDIYIEPQFKKIGKTISSVQFLIDENESYNPTFRKPNAHKENAQEQTALTEIMTSQFSLSEKQAKEILSKYDYHYIEEKIKLVKTKKNLDHAGAYLMSSLKNDYKDKAPLPTHEKKIDENSYLRESRQASEISYLKNKYLSYKLSVYHKFVEENVEKIKIKDLFEQELRKNPELFRMYKKAGLSSPFIITDYIGFIDKYFPDIVSDYLSFEDYISSEEYA